MNLLKNKKFILKTVINVCLFKPGILRDNTMDDNLMYIPNVNTQNYHFC